MPVSRSGRRLDLEAHFVTPSYVTAMEQNPGYPRYVTDPKTGRRRLYYTAEVGEPLGDVLLAKLLDVGELRLAHMDAAGIDVQVLSLTSPGVEQFDPATGSALAPRMNDELAEIVAARPDRFMGFAALAPKAPMAAAAELERAVKCLGLKGWKTHSNYGDSYLDDAQYWPILEVAEALDVPVYLHPAVPSVPALWKYGFALAGAPFGFGIDTSICMMRLVLGGVFDRFPGLKFVLGHLGEGLPFLMQRIDFAYVRPWFEPDARPGLKKRPSDYLRENVLATTSGNYLPGAFMCTADAMGIDRILLGTDYPYEDSEECVRFLEALPLPPGDRDKVYCLNATRLPAFRESG